MKNIKILALFAGLLLFVNCNEEEYAEYTAADDLSDVSWVISLEKFVQNPFSINADTFLSFFDLSQGAVSHEWIIEEGNSFLNEGFAKGDSLPLFINSSAGLSISEAKAHILFRNSGFNKVRLINKFKNPVSYKSSAGTFTAVKEGDLWVIDTTFTFDVYANLKPAFTVLQGTNEILKVTEDDMPKLSDKDCWPTVEVEAGSSLTFVDNTTIGRPNSRTWFISGGVPNQTGGTTAVIKFFKLGTYDAGSFKSLRINDLPKSETTKLIPLKIKVIPSSQPFVFDGALKEDVNQKISFRVAGEVEQFSGQEVNFTVNVSNATSGFNQNIPVQTARVNTTDATFIDLVLTAPIYNSDTITVSYSSGGGIISTDARILQSFDSKIVEMYFAGNVLPSNAHASFEQGNTAFNNAFAVNYFTGNNNANGAGGYFYERTQSKFYSGTASMKFQSTAANPVPTLNLWSFGLGEPDPIPAGTYIMSYWLYLETGTTLKAFRTEFDKPAFQRHLWDISTLEQGKWVKISKVITTDEITPAMNFRLTFTFISTENPGVTGAQTVYIDELTWVKLEVRP